MAKNTQQPELSMVDQVRIRREKLAQLQQEGQNPFAQTKFEFTSNSAEIKKNFEQMEGKEVSVSGRLMTKRGMGKVMFCDLQDAAGRIQSRPRSRTGANTAERVPSTTSASPERMRFHVS